MAIRPYKNKPNKWHIDISMGVGKRKMLVFEGTRQEAVMLHHQLQISLKKTKTTTSTINNIAPSYLNWVNDHQSGKTHKDKKRMLFSNLLFYFGNMLPDTIDTITIDNYQHKRKQEIVSKMAKGGHAAINKELLCLSAMVSWARDRGLCKNKLAEYKKLQYKRPLPNVLTIDEIRLFINACDPFWKALFLCLYQAGLRKQEALTLTKDRVNMEGRYIIAYGKGNKERIIPMTVNIYDALMELDPQGHIIFENTKTHTYYTDIRKAIKKIKDKAGIQKRITPHLLRHSFGVHLVGQGVHIRSIQDLLGHQDVSTTMLYTQTSELLKRKAVEALEF